MHDVTRADVDSGRAHPQPCGLVLNEMDTPEYKSTFVTGVCAGIADDACLEKYRRTFVARLAERYVNADFAMLTNRCTAHPIECRDLRTIELWTLGSHDDALRAAYKAAVAANEVNYRQQVAAAAESQRVEREQRAQESRERKREWIQAIAAGLQAYSEQKASERQADIERRNRAAMPTRLELNCTTNAFGNTTQTTCR